MRLHNLPSRNDLRRELRSQLTPAESLLWAHLQRRQLLGRKFRRQHGVDNYILDFYCPAEKLGVELDGASHDHEVAQDRDSERSEFLRRAGIRVVRFENREVRENLEGVLLEIARHFRNP